MGLTNDRLPCWAIMFGMNRSGYDALSSSLQAEQLQFLETAVNEHLSRFRLTAQGVSEAIRVTLKQLALPDIPSSALMPSLFAGSKATTNTYLGLSDGTLVGYGEYVAKTEFTVAYMKVPGVIQLDYCDEFGRALRPAGQVLNYNASLRPWYKLAASRWGTVQMSDVYSFSNGNTAGTTFSVAVNEAMDPPLFTPPLQHVPAVVNRTGIGGVLLVVGVDVELELIAGFLSRISGTRSPLQVISWIFDNRGYIVATSDPAVNLKTSEGRLQYALEVGSPLIVEAMRYLLGASGSDWKIPVVADYNGIRRMVSQEAALMGGSFLVSHTQINPSNQSDVVWHIASAQLRSIYYQPIADANTVALILILVLMLPTALAMSGCLALHLLSVPTRQIAKKMDNLTKDFDFGEEQPTWSHISEVRTIQQSYASLRNAVKSFSKFAPVHVVKSLLFNRNEATLGVEDTDCTIFFSDILGFTQISESVAPEVLIATLGEYLDAMATVIEKHNGLFLDFQGDSVFAQFVGYDHELRTVETAVEQQQILHSLRMSWKQRGMPEFFVRMGLNSGTVMAGNIGSPSHMKYTCIGDDVNLAARLEGLSRLYGVSMVLAHSTFNTERVRERFVGRCLDYISVLGKQNPTLIVTVIARRESATAVDLGVEQLSFRAMEEYVAGRFESCLATLKQLCSSSPEDVAEACRGMMQRVQLLVDAGGAVPEGWTGATSITEK